LEEVLHEEFTIYRQFQSTNFISDFI